jgi:peptide/nickel transport system permease protein
MKWQRSGPLVAGATILAVCLAVSLGAARSAPFPPDALVAQPYLPPGRPFWFGTDVIGRDLLSRVIYGIRTSMTISASAICLATAVGTGVGMTAGFAGGAVDQVVMRVLDIFFAFPAILLAIVVVAVLGPSMRNVILTIAVVYMPRLARVARAPTLAVKTQPFVEAARACGGSTARLLLRHVLPNISSPVIVEATLDLSRALITESALSFLGLGVPPPAPTLGAMLAAGKEFLLTAPWVSMAPGIAITVMSVGFVLFGIGLRDVLSRQP